MSPVSDDRMAQIRHKRRREKRILQEMLDDQEEVERNRDAAEDPRSNALVKYFDLAEFNRTRAKSTRQHVVDAQIFRRLGEYSRTQSAQLQTGLTEYGVRSLVDALVLIMERTQPVALDASDAEGEEKEMKRINLGALGRGVASKFRDPPALDFMFGNLPDGGAQAPMTQMRRRPQRVRKGERAERPAQLAKGDVEEGGTRMHVARMMRALRQARQVGLWQFVLDPCERKGFVRTVENLFHVSFLVRDGRARMDTWRQPPTLTLVEKKAKGEEGEREEEMEAGQLVLGFDVGEWRRVKEEYGIRKAWLPRGEAGEGGRRLVERDENDGG